MIILLLQQWLWGKISKIFELKLKQFVLLCVECRMLSTEKNGLTKIEIIIDRFSYEFKMNTLCLI